MSGLKQATRWRAMRARFRRRISSSLLPENIGPVITSMRPTSVRPDAGGVMMRMPLRSLENRADVSQYPTRNPAVDFASQIAGESLTRVPLLGSLKVGLERNLDRPPAL